MRIPEADRRSATLGLGLIALAVGVLHVVCIARYGYFRDELYYLACAHHLAWGYVDHPPLSIAALWVVTHLSGNSLESIRFLPAVAGSALVFSTGRFARQFGAGRFGQWIAALAVAVAPVFLAIGSLFSMNAFEPLLWLGAAWTLVRVTSGKSERWWLAFGAFAGLGLENKHSMLFFGFAVAVGLLLTPEQRYLRSKWFWLGGALAVALFSPNLIWEIRHRWPTLEFMTNAELHKNYHAPLPKFLLGQLQLIHPLASLVSLAGLWYLFSNDGRRHRVLGWAYLTLLALFVAKGAKIYYLAPAYPILIAPGGARLEQLLGPHRWIGNAYAALLAIGGLATAPLVLPILSPRRLAAYTRAFPGARSVKTERHREARLPQQFADQFGWHRQVAAVAASYASLTPEERTHAAILAANYGEAGAIDLFGPKLGLPRAYSAHNAYWMWGPPPHDPTVLVTIGIRRTRLEPHCAELERRPSPRCEYCMPYEDGAPISICRGLELSLSKAWPQIRSFE